MNKRLLALIVAVIFIIGSVATGFAATFEDVVDTDFEDEVNRLVALEIISGYPDGTFRPEGLVTRAEFAKITVSATGVGAAAEYAKGATKFTDVEAEHWAAGYINVATDLGIIQGYGDGRFGPEDQVTYAEAITMIVRSLGYEPAAQAKGGYPGGYLAVAAENDITDGITVLANVAANRGDIAVMVDNSLEVDMMVQDGYGDRPTWKVEKGETLLSKLGVDEVEGKVVEIARVKDSKLDDKEIRVELNDDDETVKKYELVSKDNPEALFGLAVKLLVKGKKVVHVEVDTAAKDVIVDTVKTDVGDGNEVELKVEDDKFKFDKAEVYINFELKNTKAIKEDMYGTFIFDKKDIIFVNLFKFDEVGGLVTNVAKDEIELALLVDGEDDVLDLEDYDEIYVYNKDFTAASLDDIDEGSVIYYHVDDDDVLFVVVANDVVKGEVTRARANEVRVGGKYYDFVDGVTILSKDDGKSFESAEDKGTDLVDEDVVIYLDLNGDVAAVVTEADVTSEVLYGIVTWAEPDTFRNPIVTIFTAEGKEVDYEVEKRGLAGAVELGDADYLAVAYKLNSDGEITKIEVIGEGKVLDEFASEGEIEVANIKKAVDKKYITEPERYYLTKDTVLMWAVDSDNDVDPTLVKYDDLVGIELKGEAADNAIIFGDEGKNAKFIVFTSKDFAGAKDDTYYGVVTGKPVKEGKNWYVEIDVFGEGVDEYKLEDDDALDGNKLVVFNLDGKDRVKLANLSAEDTVRGTVYKDGNFVKVNDKTYKVLSGALVYEYDDGDLDKARLSKVKDEDQVRLLLKDDEVKVIIILKDDDISFKEEED